jgi:hypothetical protein
MRRLFFICGARPSRIWFSSSCAGFEQGFRLAAMHQFFLIFAQQVFGQAEDIFENGFGQT